MRIKSYYEGRMDEQERIVKLFEEMIRSRPEDWQMANKGYSFEHLIALIKGEK